LRLTRIRSVGSEARLEVTVLGEPDTVSTIESRQSFAQRGSNLVCIAHNAEAPHADESDGICEGEIKNCEFQGGRSEVC
jgi:hypothetical protein